MGGPGLLGPELGWKQPRWQEWYNFEMLRRWTTSRIGWWICLRCVGREVKDALEFLPEHLQMLSLHELSGGCGADCR